jgi:ribosomal protein S18 acetylase RimI-like enzyme
MESFRIDGNSARDFTLGVEEADDVTPELVRTLIDIDVQTFAESTFTPYTAAAFLKGGRVFLLRADDVVIGTCVCLRSWERPNEAMLLTMGIRPGWRGRGLGQRFVSGVLERLKARGLRSVSLLVGKNNRRAIKVYTDVGFAPVEEREVDPMNDDDVLLMRVTLQSDPQLIELP